MSSLSPNEAAIRKYVASNRPDLLPMMDRVFKNDGMFLLAAIGFEAGREFQQAHPHVPLGPIVDDPTPFNGGFEAIEVTEDGRYKKANLWAKVIGPGFPPEAPLAVCETFREANTLVGLVNRK